MQIICASVYRNAGKAEQEQSIKKCLLFLKIVLVNAVPMIVCYCVNDENLIEFVDGKQHTRNKE